MHSVSETHAFRRQASEAGMSEDEIRAFVDFVAANPTAGVEIPGTGGCRKVRVAGRGKGKSGGFRVIMFYSGELMPVVLVAVFSKGERSNLTQAERNGLKALSAALVEEYKVKVRKVGEAR